MDKINQICEFVLCVRKVLLVAISLSKILFPHHRRRLLIILVAMMASSAVLGIRIRETAGEGEEKPVKYAPAYCRNFRLNCQVKAAHVCCRFPLPPTG